MKYSCVLFDLDQTLLLRTPTIPQKLSQLLGELKIGRTMDQIDKAFAECEFWIGEQTRIENQTGIRMSDDEFLAKMIAVYQKNLALPEDSISPIQTLLCGQYAKTYSLMPDALNVLAVLKEKGVKLGIVSNNYKTIHKTLSEFGLSTFFDCIVISKEVGLQKPNPEIILLACKLCGVEPSQAIYVGDHPFDIICAHDAGASAAWLPPSKWYRLPDGSKQPEIILEKLTNLPLALA